MTGRVFHIGAFLDSSQTEKDFVQGRLRHILISIARQPDFDLPLRLPCTGDERGTKCSIKAKACGRGVFVTGEQIDERGLP